MEFTPDQEQKLIEENMPKIYRAVDNFAARYSSNARIPYDDLVQEVSIAFLKYIRKCETEQQVSVFPWFSAMGAMRDLVLQSQPVSCPKSSHLFSEIIHNMPRTVSIDAIRASGCMDIDGMSKTWVDDKETQMDFDLFMEGQPESVRRMASMRVYGMNVNEVANQYGISRQSVRKRLNKLNDAYKNFMEDAENAE